LKKANYKLFFFIFGFIKLTINKRQTLIKKITKLFLVIFAMLSIFSCVSRDSYKDFKSSELSVDTSNLFVSYKNTVFCVPSPQFVNLYLKHLGVYPIKSATNPVTNIEKYATSLKKAVNLGIYGADIGYLNIFSASENTNEYMLIIDQLANDLNLKFVFTKEVYNQILALKNNQDSLAHYLGNVFTRADNYLKENSQQQTSVLVIAGGWIESFYLLCYTYTQYKSNEIRNMIFQQKFILDNLIKVLAPFYESSKEIQELIDGLVEIAYDFDMLDFKYKYENPIVKYHNDLLIINNECQILNAEISLETIIKKTSILRLKQIS
jgi:hypothetical protein